MIFKSKKEIIMKKLSLLSLLLAGLLVFSSCDKGELGPVANTSDPGAPEISSPSSGENFVLSEDDVDAVAMTIEWTKPDFGFSSAPDYSIQFAESGEDAEYIQLGSTQGNSLEVETQDINNALISEGFLTGEEHSINLRVVASLPDDSVSAVHSEPVSISVTPYFAEVSYPEIYVPGVYQATSNEGNEWDPSTAPALYSFEEDDTYEGYVYIADAGSEFKFTAERNWDDEEWGDDEGDGTLDPGTLDNNIVADESGYYYMDVNLNEMTYSLTPTEWGVTGDATPNGWVNPDEGIEDHDMTYDPDEKVWTIDLELSEGEMKFRANDAWDLNYGDDEGDGRLDKGSDGNITVDQAGNYTIVLDLSEAPYTYELNQN